MYRQVADFVKDYREEAREAQKNWDMLTDEALKQSAGEDFQPIAGHLWHIASIWHYVFCDEFKLWPQEELVEQPPETAAGLAEFYRNATAKACNWIEANWHDEDLLVEIEIWGMKMTRGKLLFEIVKHEAHHRGQVIALMRLAGLPVHGIYGPSKEEAAAMQKKAEG